MCIRRIFVVASLITLATSFAYGQQYQWYEDTPDGPVSLGLGDAARIHNQSEYSMLYEVTAGQTPGGEVLWSGWVGPGAICEAVPQDHSDPSRLVGIKLGMKGKDDIDAICRVDCLAATTRILTPRGPRHVSALNASDHVVGRRGSARILEIRRTRARQLVQVEVGCDVLRTSIGHRFLTRHHGWIAARFLRPGMVLTGGGEMPVIVERVAIRDLHRPVELFSVIVEDGKPLAIGGLGIRVESGRG